MKRKFIYFGVTIFVILIATLHVLIWRMKDLQEDQYLVRVYSEQIFNISLLFAQASTVQQQQTELRFGLLGDVTPLVDNVLAMDRLVEKVEYDISQPALVDSCVECHSRAGDTRWRAMPDKLEHVKETLDRYKLQMSEVVTASGMGLKNDMERRALTTGKQLVASSEEFNDLFAVILNHVIDESNARRRKITYEIMAVFLLGVLMIGLLFYRFSKKMVQPIVRLAEATDTLSEGQFPAPIEVKTKDELEHLAAAFNNMVLSLEKVTGERERLLAQSRSFNETLEIKIEEAKQQLAAAQEGLLRQEKLSAIGTLASGVAHEISNPIHIVQGMCTLIKEDLEEDSSLYNDLTLIDKEVGRCQRIVDELLDFSRIKEVRISGVDLNALVESTVEMARRRKGAKRLTIETALEPSLPSVTIDADRLKQVIVNLVFNAMDAISETGTIRIGTSVHEDHAHVTVEDNGKGIAKENLSRIFDPFFTTKKGSEGTGMGLAVCYRIVEEFGGAIEVESEEARGTIFTVNLPFEHAQQVSASNDEMEQSHVE